MVLEWAKLEHICITYTLFENWMFLGVLCSSANATMVYSEYLENSYNHETIHLVTISDRDEK